MSFFDFLAAGAEFQADKAMTKAKRAEQKYRNAMTNVSAALSQNNITVNELMTNTALSRRSLEIQSDYEASFGAQTVSSAAAYTGGKSTARSLLMLKQNKDMAETLRQQDMTDAWLGFDQQRQNTAIQAVMQQDHSYIPKPNLATYLFKAAAKTANQMM